MTGIIDDSLGKGYSFGNFVDSAGSGARRAASQQTMRIRAYQKMDFFENSGAVFYFMHKCPKKPRKKISGDLRVI